MKKIDFPKEEIPTISKQEKIITHRVLDDVDKFDKGDTVVTQWNQKYKVTGKRIISSIDKSPFVSFLTKEQYDFLRTYDRISVLRLEKYEIGD